MNIYTKKFDELSNRELYEILKIRSAIFVVEQNCIYQDIDGIDYRSTHVFIEENNEIIAYLRIFDKDEKTVQIGRVLTLNHGEGYGGILLNYSMNYLKDTYVNKRIFLEAQCYAVGFYEKEGFKICSDEFLEDGITHVEMELYI